MTGILIEESKFAYVASCKYIIDLLFSIVKNVLMNFYK